MRFPVRPAALGAAALLAVGAAAGTASARDVRPSAPSVEAPTVFHQAEEGPCKQRGALGSGVGAYLSPFGHADITISSELLGALKEENASWNVSDPLIKMPHSNDKARFPLGYLEDSIEPDLHNGLRVCYPGKLTIARNAVSAETGKKDHAQCDGIWLTVVPTGVWCNLSVNNGPEKRTFLGTTTAVEAVLGSTKLTPAFVPRINPKTFELGIGPRDWQFRLSKDASKVLASVSVDIPAGTPIFNLDATLSFLPGPDFWKRLLAHTPLTPEEAAKYS
ncbi:hypothetical protein ACIBUY_33490 [Streptomyces sp. NPDC050085]|uniref:hypothetical protein n=1 Tax=Streptomyces sp. NPDC050085 TaxID=3365600 RepID=UPI003787B3E7